MAVCLLRSGCESVKLELSFNYFFARMEKEWKEIGN